MVKKIITEEERKARNRAYVRKYLDKKPKWHCEVCDKTYHAMSKARHLKSKVHVRLGEI